MQIFKELSLQEYQSIPSKYMFLPEIMTLSLWTYLSKTDSTKTNKIWDISASLVIKLIQFRQENFQSRTFRLPYWTQSLQRKQTKIEKFQYLNTTKMSMVKSLWCRRWFRSILRDFIKRILSLLLRGKRNQLEMFSRVLFKFRMRTSSCKRVNHSIRAWMLTRRNITQTSPTGTWVHQIWIHYLRGGFKVATSQEQVIKTFLSCLKATRSKLLQMGNASAIQEIKDTDTQNKQKYRLLRQNNGFRQQICRYCMVQTKALTLGWGH